MSTAAPHPLTVAIPTFNGADRIHLPLDALARLATSHPPGELVVVDNASTDNTSRAATASNAWRELTRLGWDCRVVREDTRGLTAARLRALRESHGEFVGFLDDDTAPQDGYLAAVLLAFADPEVGAVVSRVSIQPDVPAPPAILRRRHLLADNTGLGDQPLHWLPGDPALAPTLGAGLWLRRTAARRAFSWDSPADLLSDRRGHALVGSGDIELGHRIGEAGYVRRYDPALRLTHHIPASRLDTRYFCRLIVGTVRGELTLRARYDTGKDAATNRPLAVARMLGALIALPWLALRPDGGREIVFVLADRWARCQGPYAPPQGNPPEGGAPAGA